jgi:hypothetical protein
LTMTGEVRAVAVCADEDPLRTHSLVVESAPVSVRCGKDVAIAREFSTGGSLTGALIRDTPVDLYVSEINGA